jgi:hypothetical protein
MCVDVVPHGVEVVLMWQDGDIVATVALGSWPRQGLARVRAKREARESHFMLLGVQKIVREWTLTLPRELPLWESESGWTLKFLERDCKSQNSLDWGVLYIIGKPRNVDVWNRLAWPIWTSETQVMAKRKAESQIGNLTPDH